ncbi:hypothetical protein ACIRL0_29460 [Streptomyces sp. NPDC102365]|uniref:hypothetical protein n=1 Tax=Streptomyces sp. NPDC102365 TaxID=3366162 RepID=UPI003811F48C
MTMREQASGGVEPAIHLHGFASHGSQLNQAGRDQTVTNLNLHMGAAEGQVRHTELDLRISAETAQEHAQYIIEALALAVEHFSKRCVMLTEEARRARAEGRSEALREVQERLRDAELRVISAQAKKREAENERERLEALIATARYEAEAARRRPARSWEPADDESAFENVLTSADAGLASLRAELRALADDLGKSERSPAADRIVRAEVVPDASSGPVPSMEKQPARATDVQKPVPSLQEPHPPVTPSGPRRVVSPTRRWLGRLFFVAALVPMPLAGAAIRLVYTRDPGVALAWRIIFPPTAVILAAVAISLLILFAKLAYAWPKDDGSVVLGCVFHAFAGGCHLLPERLRASGPCFSAG